MMTEENKLRKSEEIKMGLEFVMGLAPIIYDQFSGKMTKRFMRIKKYKRMTSKRKKEMREWKMQIMKPKVRKLVIGLLYKYSEPDNRKKHKQILDP